MSFYYEKKETYTQADLDKLLEQHENFTKKGLISKTDFDNLNIELEKAKKELIPFKENSRSKHIIDLVGDITSDKKLKAAIKLANIQEDTKDEDIISLVKKTVEDNEFLQDVVAPKGDGVTTVAKPTIVPNETPYKRQFIKNDVVSK